MSSIKHYKEDFWQSLRKFTTARIALGRAGGSLTTEEQLKLFRAHAQARDAVKTSLETDFLEEALSFTGMDILQAYTNAQDREAFLLRPDWGRQLQNESLKLIKDKKGDFDLVLIIGDGLSAKAIHRHVPPLLKELLPKLNSLMLAPLIVVHQARVAVSDAIGEALGAKLAVILIGERPGLSSPDSLGIYLTYGPRMGQTDEKRNCISNVRPEGMSYAWAAEKLSYLIHESIRRKISGVQLKDDLQIKLEG